MKKKTLKRILIAAAIIILAVGGWKIAGWK